MRKPRSEYPSEQADKFLLRFPDGLRDRIKAAAEANGRSMNAEIIERLQFSFNVDDLNKRSDDKLEEMVIRNSYETMRHEMAATQRRFAEIVDSLAKIEESMRARGIRPDD